MMDVGSLDGLAVDKPWLMLGDCLERMREIPDGSVDMVMADLPYQITACQWDIMIPFEPLWAQYERVTKPNAAIVLTAGQPFTSALVMSKPKWFSHEWIWEKPNNSVGRGLRKGRDEHKKGKTVFFKNNDGMKYPRSVQKFNRATGLHSCQKPVALLEYLIRTYTTPGETVLDNCFGSGSTGVACVNIGRRFIGVEKDAGYFDVGRRRIDAAIAVTQPAPQGGLFETELT